MKAALSLFFRYLHREQRGAVALTWIIIFPVILLTLLAAIDFIRYSVVQSKLQNALDTAVISAGRNLDKFTPLSGSSDETRWRADAISYFFSNISSHFLGSSISQDQVTINYEEETSKQGIKTGQIVRMKATGSLPLLTTGFLSRPAFTLHAENEAIRRTRRDVEMVLALDNTGSMSNENRIGALKQASKELINTVLSASGNGRSYIGLVPFADTTYIGTDKTRWLNSTAQSWPYIKAGQYWGGCVVEPYTDNTFRPEPGLPGDFNPLMTIGTRSVKLADLYGKNNGYSVDPASITVKGSREKLIRTYTPKDDVINVEFAFNSRYHQMQYGDTGWRSNCPSGRKMQFLNNDASALTAKINAMFVDGRTIIPLGLLWAWRMLDPAWRGNNGWGDSEKPQDAAPGLTKVIVLLTDGNNGLDPIIGNTLPAARGTPGVAIDGGETHVSYSLNFNYRQKTADGSWSGIKNGSYSVNENMANDHYFLNATYANSPDFNSLRTGSPTELANSRTANGTQIKPYGLLFQGHNGNHSDWEGGNKTLNTLTSDLCQRIKTNGITLYTVVLGSGTNSSTKAMMQNCSSDKDHNYFDATNVGDLSSAFASIAASLTELRLDK